MAQQKITSGRLDDMLDHLHYEVGQLVLQLRLPNPWTSVLAQDLQRFAQRSIFEAGLIHLRVLVEFLGDPPNRSGRVVARDYLGSAWTWKASEELKKKIDAVHTRLAHLGLDRVTEPAFEWGDWLSTNLPAVLKGVRDFLVALKAASPARYERFASRRHDGWIFTIEVLTEALGEQASPQAP